MSLDLYLVCPHCRRGHHRSLNITHNVAPICRAAGCDPWEWQGLSPAETVPSLRAAIDSLTERPQDFVHLNPENGWGDVGGTLGFLRDVLAVAEGRSCDYPEDPPDDTSAYRWKVSR